MKIKIAKGELLEVLQVVQGIVNVRAPLPILSNVLLEAQKGKLSLTTTDLEVGVKCSVAAKVEKGGTTTVPARRLMSIVRELPADEIEMVVDDKHTTTIKCGSSIFKIMGLSEDEFPPLANLGTAASYTIDQGMFKEMLTNTHYAASSDETRYVLNGVLLSFKGEKLTMVATDGRRLALMEHEMEFPKDREGTMIVPTKAVTELLHALKDEGELKILSAENQVGFEFNDTLVVSKLVDGTYPNYNQVIPAQCDQRVTLEREELLTAVRRVALLTSDKSSSVRLTFAKNKLRINVVTPDVGEAEESTAVKYNGKEISVAFDPEYLMDPLRHLTSDEVYLEITDDLSPGVLKCGAPFLYVLMPMRIS